MHKKIFIYSIIPVLGLVLFSAQPVSAHGMGGGMGMLGGFGLGNPDQIATAQQTMFQKEADLLGVSLDDVKNAWAEGKSMAQLAKEKGITQQQLQDKMNQSRTSQIKAQIQSLVDKGIITQDQANKRLQFVQTKSTGKYGKTSRFFHGMGMHW